MLPARTSRRAAEAAVRWRHSASAVPWDDAARKKWLAEFQARRLEPLNTKVLARLPLKRSSVPLPGPLAASLAHNSVSSDRYRSQSQNLQDALAKLHAEIARWAADGLRGETSPEQRERVAALQRKERERTRKAKEKRSLTKQSRKVQWD